MSASSPVTFDNLVNGLKFYVVDEVLGIAYNEDGGRYAIKNGSDYFNTVEISQDGLTISFGPVSGGPNYTGFTFNA